MSVWRQKFTMIKTLVASVSKYISLAFFTIIIVIIRWEVWTNSLFTLISLHFLSQNSLSFIQVLVLIHCIFLPSFSIYTHLFFFHLISHLLIFYFILHFGWRSFFLPFFCCSLEHHNIIFSVFNTINLIIKFYRNFLFFLVLASVATAVVATKIKEQNDCIVADFTRFFSHVLCQQFYVYRINEALYK